MTLGSKQKKFALMLAHLVVWAFENGFEVTYGDAFRDPRAFGKVGIRDGYGRANSLHKMRLAVDLNLFKNGKYLTKTSDHLILGTKWEEMGGDWGGRFDDGNHYSYGHQGLR